MKRDKALAFIEAFKKVRETVPDDVAKENIGLYPEWTDETFLKEGTRVQYNGKLYKVLQDHTSRISWNPEVALTIFEPLDIVNDGTIDTPIIAAVGMTYYKDKYYLDETDGKVYLCIRDDTGNGTTLYHMPSALVNVYFSLA